MAQIQDRKYTALVTGFGFYGEIPITAGMVARLLPKGLSADDALNSSKAEISILDAQADFACIPAELGAIRRRVKELHTEYGSNIDLWIHLGQWTQNWVTCERRAFRQDFTSTWNEHNGDKHYYMTPDSIGQVSDDLGPNPWLSVPIGLDSEVPINTTVSTANEALNEHHAVGGTNDSAPLKVQSHVEAGGQGCGFIFYESMANCFVNGRKRDVVFVHVPPESDEACLHKAKDAVLAIIAAAVTAIRQRRSQSVEETRYEFAQNP